MDKVQETYKRSQKLRQKHKTMIPKGMKHETSSKKSLKPLKNTFELKLQSDAFPCVFTAKRNKSFHQIHTF